MEKLKVTGIDLISAERLRQEKEEGWTPEHDDSHDNGELALAAVCYATPVLLYQKEERAGGTWFKDPWPWPRELPWGDKRFRCGERKDNPGNTLPDPATYTDEERLDLLVKAGALIAAEIDRLLRRQLDG